MKSKALQKGIGEVKRALKNFETNEIRNRENKEVFAGISGGADSLALAIVLSKSNLKNGWNAIIIDHQLQNASDLVAAKTAQICKSLGAKTTQIVKVKVETNSKDGIEAAARRARFNAFAKVIHNLVCEGGDLGNSSFPSQESAKVIREKARKENAVSNQQISKTNALTRQSSLLLLAHTQDDQAESVLLALARGSGITALSAIKEVAQISTENGDLKIIRPLLNLTREETEEICSAEKVEFHIDPTNFGNDGDPIRSQLRKKVIPEFKKLFPGISKNLARTAKIANAAEKCIDFQNDKIGKNTPLLKLPDYLRWREISLIVQNVNGDQVQIERIWEVDEVLLKMNRGSGTEVEFENGIVLKREKRDGNMLLVCYNRGKRLTERLIR